MAKLTGTKRDRVKQYEGRRSKLRERRESEERQCGKKVFTTKHSVGQKNKTNTK